MAEEDRASSAGQQLCNVDISSILISVVLAPCQSGSGRFTESGDTALKARKMW